MQDDLRMVRVALRAIRIWEPYCLDAAGTGGSYPACLAYPWTCLGVRATLPPHSRRRRAARESAGRVGGAVTVTVI